MPGNQRKRDRNTPERPKGTHPRRWQALIVLWEDVGGALLRVALTLDAGLRLAVVAELARPG
jgi:hypothetical protein